MPFTFAKDSSNSIPLHIVRKSEYADWLATLSRAQQAWVKTNRFSGAIGETITFPDAGGTITSAACGYGSARDQQRVRFALGMARGKLPLGNYALTGNLGTVEKEEAALGWLLAGYRFTRYAGSQPQLAQLQTPDGIDAKKIETFAAGEALTRDLINIPSSDMGPAELETAARALATKFGASIQVTTDGDLLDANFPMIHAVGRASNRAPRLIDMSWGSSGPKLTLVGKGVCFDTGGLNIKPGASMGLMKKDMGGSAAVLGLAHMIMTLGMAVQLRVLIPAVENSIGSSAFRPGDILTARNGLTVEINNTDAEGRLVLADALALASEDNPDLVLSMATLTGAARVAVGPDLAPFFATNPSDANAIRNGASQSADPVWELPFWEPYEKMIEPGIADLDNAPKGGQGGAITAALFLRRFVPENTRYMHFDIYGWQPVSAPARPKGGTGQAARAIFTALPELLDL